MRAGIPQPKVQHWDPRRHLAAGVLLLLYTVGCSPGRTTEPQPLVVFNAGSLAKPFSDLLRAFKAKHPEVVPAQENSGSLEAARKLTELGKIPDVIGVADYGVISKLLVPQHAGWFATFARNSMVLIHTDQSAGASEINGENWWQVLIRPGMRAGRSDPALDPNGYRTLMVFQLAEKHYKEPGLAARLVRAFPPKYIRPKEADLTALVQAGELDYSWSYASIAKTAGLPYVNLPGEVNLSDPKLAEWYGQARVRLPGTSRGGKDSVGFRGEPIVYALTIPRAAAHPGTAREFVRFVFSPEGQSILRANGFIVLEKPVLGGPERPPDGLF
ncbi:MAG TPA: extracellular solute-binding protein [Gemmatimonadales bacterium]|nr:extracellular solute-binding protein [Gemmatimonadales bacterium]